MIRIDLHMHSTCSDGAYPPSGLVRLSSLHRIAVAALTDHDTTAGVPQFLSACKRRGIRGVAGVEISTRHEGGDELHILGYRFDLGDAGLADAFARCRVARRARSEAICARLASLGVPVSMDEVEARAGGGVVGRPHIAQVIVDKGRAATIKEAFVRYLGRGASAYIPRELMSSAEAVRLIREAGGLPVWAHPFTSLSDPHELGPVMDHLMGHGLWGVECRAHGASPAQKLVCMNEAGRRGLYMTAGSDFHGRPGHGARLSGHVVEDDALPWARLCGGL